MTFLEALKNSALILGLVQSAFSIQNFSDQKKQEFPELFARKPEDKALFLHLHPKSKNNGRGEL
jgi:hypothetical protein